MSVMNQLAASVTGNIEQAYLVIYDYRKTCAGGAGGKKGQALAMKFFRKKDALARAAAAEDKPVVPGAEPPTPSGTVQKIFKVQFNPSQLTINASNISVGKSDAQGGQSVQDTVTKAKLTMTTALYFDEMNVYDSFMWDKFTGGLTAQGAKNIATAVMSAKGKTWTVQDEVEGLISALRNPLTRNIAFRWTDFVFSGQLSNVSAQYTMFSTSGKPVRAKVTLKICHEMDDSYLAPWYNDYNKAFTAPNSSLVGAAQKVGNLLNVSL